MKKTFTNKPGKGVIHNNQINTQRNRQRNAPINTPINTQRNTQRNAQLNTQRNPQRNSQRNAQLNTQRNSQRNFKSNTQRNIKKEIRTIKNDPAAYFKRVAAFVAATGVTLTMANGIYHDFDLAVVESGNHTYLSDLKSGMFSNETTVIDKDGNSQEIDSAKLITKSAKISRYELSKYDVLYKV